MALWVKICGVTTVEDALMVADAGADAIGLNFVSASPRCITIEEAAKISQALDNRVELIGVFVDADLQELVRTVEGGGLSGVQLHGSEPGELLDQLGGLRIPSYKALRIGDEEDVALAEGYPGMRILVDAKVKGAMGGTGATFDWSLIRGLNMQRDLILAGGLKPENVSDAVFSVRPFGVDTASGVESAPGVKDEKMVKAFVQNARAASD